MTDVVKHGERVVPDGRKVRSVVVGYAVVMFCDPDPNSYLLGDEEPGCGVFMFFKPERNKIPSNCPVCDRRRPWNQIQDELASIEVVKL